MERVHVVRAGPWGLEDKSPPVDWGPGESPGSLPPVGSLGSGDKVAQKLKQNVKFAYNF